MPASIDMTPRRRLFARVETIAAVAVIGILGLAVGVAALVAPAHQSRTHHVTFSQSGVFSYSAAAKNTSLYGDGQVRSGDPILIGSVGPVQASFAYRLAAGGAVQVHGSASLDAVVAFPGGFSRAFPVVTTQAFTGADFVTSGTLPLPAIMSFVSSAGRTLGPGVGVGATVSLRPHVTVAGLLDGHPIATSYVPSLPFNLSDHTMTVSPQDGVSESVAAELRPALQGTVSYRTSEPTRLQLAVVHPDRTLALTVGLGLAGLCLLLAVLLGRSLRRSGEANLLRDMQGAPVVAVRALRTPAEAVAEVASAAALAELAKRYESVVMHVVDEDAYCVWDNGLLFRFGPQDVATEAAVEPQPEPEPLVLPEARAWLPAPAPAPVALAPERLPAPVGPMQFALRTDDSWRHR